MSRGGAEEYMHRRAPLSQKCGDRKTFVSTRSSLDHAALRRAGDRQQDRLDDLVAGVHDERAVAEDRLADGIGVAQKDDGVGGRRDLDRIAVSAAMYSTRRTCPRPPQTTRCPRH